MVELSVIVSTYNIENYIEECMECLCRQSYEDFELLVIDSSTDGTISVLEKFSERDERIRIIKQKKSGLASARNEGIRLAHGKNILFLDGDDLYDLSMLEKIIRQINTDKAEICLFGGDNYNDVTKKIEHHTLLWPHFIGFEHPFIPYDNPEYLFQVATPTVNTKLFSRELIERIGLRFQLIERVEDLYFSYMAMALAKTITYVDEPLFHYRYNRKGNLSSGSSESPTCYLLAYEKLYYNLCEAGLFEHYKKTFIESLFATSRYERGLLKSEKQFEMVKSEWKRSTAKYDIKDGKMPW